MLDIVSKHPLCKQTTDMKCFPRKVLVFLDGMQATEKEINIGADLNVVVLVFC